MIADGSYSIDSATGPTPGKYKVSIRSSGEESGVDLSAAPGAPPKINKKKPAAADPIPKKYNTDSTLTAEVLASGTTTADFALESK